MDDVCVPAKKSNAYDGPEFVVTSEFFDRFFEKPMPTSTFHGLVNKACIIPWHGMRGKYLLNASLHRMKLPTVDKLPREEPKRSLEDITRFAFTLIDSDLFPAPSWLLSVEFGEALFYQWREFVVSFIDLIHGFKMCER